MRGRESADVKHGCGSLSPVLEDRSRSGSAKVRLNLWLSKGSPPDTDAPAEVVISSFRFAPLLP